MGTVQHIEHHGPWDKPTAALFAEVWEGLYNPMDQNEGQIRKNFQEAVDELNDRKRLSPNHIMEQTHEDQRRVMQQHAWLGVVTAAHRPWTPEKGQKMGIPHLGQDGVDWAKPTEILESDTKTWEKYVGMIVKYQEGTQTGVIETLCQEIHTVLLVVKERLWEATQGERPEGGRRQRGLQ